MQKSKKKNYVLTNDYNTKKENILLEKSNKKKKYRNIILDTNQE